jgi:hypothetical protein
VSPWEDVSETATINKKELGWSDGLDAQPLLKEDNVPTRSKTQLFGVWNSEAVEAEAVVSVAVSGVAGVAVETKFSEPVVGVQVAFSRETGIPQPFQAVQKSYEAFGTIIGPSKPIQNVGDYVGFAEPKMVPVLLHIRERAERPKPSDVMKQFAENIVVRVLNETTELADRLSDVLNRDHLSATENEASRSAPSTLSTELKDLALAVVNALVKKPFAPDEIKQAAERVMERYIVTYAEDDDEFQWEKLAQMPLGWATADPADFQTGAIVEGDYVCMGFTALKMVLLYNSI